jgi:hypothetical protein
MDLCYQYFVVKDCLCYDYESFRYYDVRVCHTDEDIKCVRKVYHNISSSFHLNQICFPWCPLECDLNGFTKTISTSPYPPNDYYLNEFRNDPKVNTKFSNISLISDQKLRENVLKLSIYYETLSYVEISETATMTIVDLLANLGGVLGLFLGKFENQFTFN